MNILFIGDIVGRPGRQAVHDLLPEIIEKEDIHFVVANAENIAGGSGVTQNIFKKLLSYGVDFVTTGDHVWRREEIVPLLESDSRIIRPANYPVEAAGRGCSVVEAKNGVPVGVIQLIGRVFMHPARCPFLVGAELVEQTRAKTPVIIVDMHAEATSEKIAMGWHLDGKVSAVVGSHTHIATADERILPNGTAYITDAGMTGPYDSVIGREKEPVLKKFITGMPYPFDVAKGDVNLCGVIVSVDPETGRASAIKRIRVPHVGASENSARNDL
jgi:metallophosphoesterase (TIGR00282 family)